MLTLLTLALTGAAAGLPRPDGGQIGRVVCFRAHIYFPVRVRAGASFDFKVATTKPIIAYRLDAQSIRRRSMPPLRAKPPKHEYPYRFKVRHVLRKGPPFWRFTLTLEPLGYTCKRAFVREVQVID